MMTPLLWRRFSAKGSTILTQPPPNTMQQILEVLEAAFAQRDGLPLCIMPCNALRHLSQQARLSDGDSRLPGVLNHFASRSFQSISGFFPHFARGRGRR